MTEQLLKYLHWTAALFQACGWSLPSLPAGKWRPRRQTGALHLPPSPAAQVQQGWSIAGTQQHDEDTAAIRGHSSIAETQQQRCDATASL